MTPGCHNKPRATPATYLVAQSGWRDYDDAQGNPVRVPVYVKVPYSFTLPCQHEASATDAACAGCQHIKGE